MNNTSIYDVIIVGAGASGLICALECARANKHVLILEKSPLIGRKILVSGNGRCNFTNRFVSPKNYFTDEKLITSALHHFSFQDCLNYFADLGVLYTEEENGRYFPSTGKSTAITDAFKAALTENSVEILCNQEVLRIKHNKVFNMHTADNTFQSSKLVLACGSCAYPQVSGTSSGYQLAKQLGHTVTPPLASLSGLVLKENFSRLAGIRTQARLAYNGTTTEGEIIFTNYGINGPAALNLSPLLTRKLAQGNQTLTINFLPQVEDIQHFLTNRAQQFSHRKPKDFFAGILHESIANLLIDFKGLRKNKPLKEQSPAALQSAFQTLGKWPVTVISLRPWNEAMVAAGGVNTREINYNTFESCLCPGLFITGELLDVDGISGGFNLHFAWASGFMAAQELRKEN
ncbi:MAG: NAD(P)/FAD-dependent oxidoreductase [Elusimicrobiaceae bacterium]|nr:NAD(P)/FAD-dependent oxidoreductase [Elusimicrobiaceae bacterium]